MDATAIKEIAQAQAITAAAKALTEDTDVSNIVTLPNDFALHDLEKYLPKRRRARGTMSTNSIDNFAEYVKTHAEDGATVFITPETMKAVAVLNLGTPELPGHADNTAVLELKLTSPYRALLGITSNQRTQQTIAEFLEDWIGHIVCFNNDGTTLETKTAIAAVRSISIENLRKLEVEAEQFSETRSALDSVKATSKETLPSIIDFTCEPRHELTARTFSMRLSIITGEAVPKLALRIIKLEEHEEQMAEEMRGLVETALASDIPALVGSYQAK